jgi:nudix-type nucleoside diphosphatase (YffH/AdpP family)
MSKSPPEITHVATLHDGWTKLLDLTIRLPDGGTMHREVEHHGDGAAVLPYDLGRRVVLLVGQFRAPVLQAGGPPVVWEAIAGLLDGDDPETCVIREAHEEAGLRLRTVERIGTVFTSPGISTERMHLFVAPYGSEDRVSAGGGLAEEHEDIEVRELPVDRFWRMVEEGEIQDAKTLILAQALRLRRPELVA